MSSMHRQGSFTVCEAHNCSIPYRSVGSFLVQVITSWGWSRQMASISKISEISCRWTRLFSFSNFRFRVVAFAVCRSEGNEGCARPQKNTPMVSITRSSLYNATLRSWLLLCFDCCDIQETSLQRPCWSKLKCFFAIGQPWLLYFPRSPACCRAYFAYFFEFVHVKFDWKIFCDLYFKHKILWSAAAPFRSWRWQCCFIRTSQSQKATPICQPFV